jgi:hypothetical protein
VGCVWWVNLWKCRPARGSSFRDPPLPTPTLHPPYTHPRPPFSTIAGIAPYVWQIYHTYTVTLWHTYPSVPVPTIHTTYGYVSTVTHNAPCHVLGVEQRQISRFPIHYKHISHPVLPVPAVPWISIYRQLASYTTISFLTITGDARPYQLKRGRTGRTARTRTLYP